MKTTDMDIDKTFLEKIYLEVRNLNCSLSKKLDGAIISRDRIVKILGWICTINVVIGLAQIIALRLIMP